MMSYREAKKVGHGGPRDGRGLLGGLWSLEKVLSAGQIEQEAKGLCL